MERRIPVRAGATRYSSAQHQGDRADRDTARRLRDGRDSMGTPRHHIAGMNAGRWDYIFSFIKTFAKSKDPRFVLPNPSQVVMEPAFLRASAAVPAPSWKRGRY